MRSLILGFMVSVLTIAANGAVAQTSSGTAFTIARELLVTNQHVVAGCSSIEVVSTDGRRPASVIDANEQIDLALLRVTGTKGSMARLRNPRNVRLGEAVMVFGFPLTGALTSGGNFTSGLVSGLRGLRDAAGEIQITAPVQAGNSGGPLLDSSGLVIGVVQAKLDALRTAIATGDVPQNVNFAISLEVLADFLAKNNVPFRNGAASARLDTARVAEIGQSFTHRVECRGRVQETTASSEVQRAPTPGETREPSTPTPSTTPPSLGDIIERGIEAERAGRDEEAVKWYRIATEQGDARGQAGLGFMYISGRGVTQDDGMAVELFRKAAEQGNALGQFSLGRCYEYSRGVKQNFSEAANWYGKAAEQGHPQAQNQLGRLYEFGNGVPKNLAMALSLYRKAAEQGRATSQYNLGRMYENGHGVEKDDNEARSWYHKAAKQGYAPARNRLQQLGW